MTVQPPGTPYGRGPQQASGGRGPGAPGFWQPSQQGQQQGPPLPGYHHSMGMPQAGPITPKTAGPLWPMLGGAIAGVLLVVATLLPWVVLTFFGQSRGTPGIESTEGVVILVAGLIGGAAAVVAYVTRIRHIAWAAAGGGAISLIIAFMYMARFTKLSAEVIDSRVIQMGIGLIITPIAALLLTVFGVLQVFADKFAKTPAASSGPSA